MKTKNLVLAVFLLSLISLRAWSEVDDDTEGQVQSYDEIVKDLSKPVAPVQSRASIGRTSPNDSIDNTTIHAGVAYANMLETLDTPNGQILAAQPGFQVSLGVDLFSEHISSEGTLLTFGDQNYSGTRISVKEFDLMFYGKGFLIPKLKGKIGGGIAGRYLTMNQHGSETQYSSPSSVLSVGADYFFLDALSLGAEIAMRNAMTGETIDTRSYTMLVRLDTHF